VRRRLLLGLAAAALVAGCGSDKTEPPDPAAVPEAQGTEEVSYPDEGVTFEAPRGWRRQEGEAPLVAALQTGSATLALWRYPRPESQMPVTHELLDDAKEALVVQIRRRDPSFELELAKLLHVGPKRAVQVLGVGNINGNRRMIRSTHIYTERSEFVVDAYAPETVFPRVDRQVFEPVLDSLEITTPKT
jgi:hypothetical protein